MSVQVLCRSNCVSQNSKSRKILLGVNYHLSREVHGAGARILTPLGLIRCLLLLLIGNPPRLRLAIPHFSQINSDGAAGERVCFQSPSVLFIGSSEPPDERIKASPGLPERACAWSRRLRLPVEHASLDVNFSLAY